MLKKLEKLLDHAYSPYSKVKVSSIIIAKDNKEYNGVNVENASYGGTICAERSALTSAVTDGIKPKDIKEVHVFSNVGRALFPCSICLQSLSEFLDDDAKVIIHGNKEPIIKTINELIPYRVTKESF